MFMGQRVMVIGNGNGDYIDDMRGELGTVVGPDRGGSEMVIVRMDSSHILSEFMFHVREISDVENACVALWNAIGDKDALL